MDIRDSLQQARRRLKAQAERSNRLESEVLLGHALDVSRSFLYANPNLALSGDQRRAFFALVQRRNQGEPIAYITGQREFWSLPLKVTPNVLIPRPETELIVETALELLPPSPGLRVADLGTGSGAIALAISKERPTWTVHATELSTAALSVAQDNARTLDLDRVQFQAGSWCEPLEGRFELLVSNPPYVQSNDPHLSQGDCRFEPQTALCGGEDGLDAIRVIIAQAAQWLAPSGWLLLEHGFDQGERVVSLMQSAGLSRVATRRDISGLDRATAGQQ